MPMRRVRLREPSQIGPLAIVAAAATVLLLAASGTSARSRAPVAQASVWRGLVGTRPVQVPVGQREIVVLKAPSLADRVATAGGRASEVDERRWNDEALAKQKQVLSRLSLRQGLTIEPDFTYTRVLNGFAAALDPRAVAALERSGDVEGVYPVRIGYPAGLSAGLATNPRAAYGDVRLPGFDGHGVTIALLDTGVDRAHGFLAGQIRPGFDLVEGSGSAAAEASPADPASVEHHGTELAGLLVGHGGPNGLSGVAPGASLLPIRVAGWQQDARRGWVVYGRTDQTIAGLEDAVDPNGDGDAHDGARVTLLGIVEPWAAFGDGPAAMAVRGALALDNLVVTPAGNDGPAGPVFGSISGPGGAPGALTVGAADLRPRTADVRVVMRTGLRVELDTRLPLAGSVAPSDELTLPVGLPRSSAGAAQSAGSAASPPSLAEFFSRDGRSLVAGKAALVDGGSDPRQAVDNAARAGAYAVLLYGEQLPAGALGLDASVAVPVVGVPATAARGLAGAARDGLDVSVSLGGSSTHRNPAAGRVAGFSSRGLAFDGAVKPDLVGSGVGLGTAEPGVNAHGSPAFGTVNGSSVAAATVAGAAAVLAQARRGIDAPALKALLVGSARPLRGASAIAQGAGLVDLGAATAAEVVAEPVALAFSSPSEQRALRLRNVSPRTVWLNVKAPGLAVSPANVRLTPGGTAKLMVSLRPGVAAARKPRQGSIRAAPSGGGAVRVPWIYVRRPPSHDLIASVTLRRTTERPSEAAPALLTIEAGRFSLASGEVQSFSRLRIELWNARPKELGVLAQLRDGLPGLYTFALTGRGPAGEALRPGRYRLRLVAAPTDGGPPSVRTIAFPIGRRTAGR